MSDAANTTCSSCGLPCKTWEDHGAEIWCYCEDCDVETFHDYQEQSAALLSERDRSDGGV